MGIASHREGVPLFLFIALIPTFFYHFICEITMDGQSVGKRAQDIKVIKKDGSQGTFSSYFLRFLLRPIDSLYFIGLAFIFFTEKCQRLGDLAAGTIIVDVKEDLTINDLKAKSTINKEDITFQEVHLLKDKDITLIKNVLNKRSSQRNHENITLLADKIKSVLNVTSEKSDYSFLQTIVADFDAYFSG